MLVKSNHKEYCKDCLKNDVCMHREFIAEAYDVLYGHISGTSNRMSVKLSFECTARLVPTQILPDGWYEGVDGIDIARDDDGFEPLTEEQMPF